MSGGAANAAVAAEKRMAAQKMGVAELRLALAQAGVDSRNALEKSELVNLFVSGMSGAAAGSTKAPAGAAARPAAPRKAPATPAQTFELPFKVPKEIWDHVNWPNAFLVLLLGLYLFRAAGPSDSGGGTSGGDGLAGADAASRAAAYLTGEVLDVPTHGEFTRLLARHATDTGLPVVVDFYSQSCGPCRQIAPHYKALAKDMAGEAVFLKVDVNKNRATASEAHVRAMPTFHFYADGQLRHKFSGADGSRLEQAARQLASEAQAKGVYPHQDVAPAALLAHLAAAGAPDPAAAAAALARAHPPPSTAALVRALQQQYPRRPPPALTPRPLPGAAPPPPLSHPNSNAAGGGGDAALGAAATAALAGASTEFLAAELAARRDAQGPPPPWPVRDLTPGHVEAVVVVGSGPAGLSAALYAARAGLAPLMLAPSEGGQLLGKGVDVENYPGVVGYDATGRGLIGLMRAQVASFGVRHVAEAVLRVEVSGAVFKVTLNDTAKSVVRAKAVIAATGAASRWLGVAGEAALRGGGGVSACATCDGYLFRDQEVVVVGGGDTAMEDALVLARTSSKVTVVHRRGTFRASHALATQVLRHPKITVLWHASVARFVGDPGAAGLTAVELTYAPGAAKGSKQAGRPFKVACQAAFVAVGHDPVSSFLVGSGVAIGDGGYVATVGDGSTRTSVPGLFAAGDVADRVYRQAVTSAGSGAMAALDAERYLSGHA